LGTRPAFVGESYGYVTSRYNLAALAGKKVNFRWRMGTYSTTWALGWMIDNVSIYQCVRAPYTPSLSSPENGRLLSSSQPILNWTDVPYAIAYQLEVATDSSVTNLFLSQPNIPVSSSHFTLNSNLPANTRFYWHVRALNKLNKPGPWSPTWSFRTPLVTPVLSAPVNGSTQNSLRPTFSWSASPGASTYSLIVSSSSNYSSPQLNATFNASITSYTPTKDLPAGNKLYARIMANGANPSAWSSITFTMPLPPSVPALVYPTNDTLLTSTSDPPVYTPTLSWKPVTVPSGASAFDHYELQVSDKANFSHMLYPSDPLNPIDLTIPSFPIPASLPDNQSYYWRVRAYNKNNDFSSWAVFSFRTAVGMPTLVSPPNNPNTSPNSQRPVFSWNGPPDANSYTIVVSTSSSLTSPIINKTSTTTSYTPTSNLPSGKILYWHVRANGANGSSLWSSTWSFRAK
jgi:hypothetical protein